MSLAVADQERAGRRPPGAAPWVAAGVAMAATAYVALRDPSTDGGFVPCPFHALTGWWCPGCGMTRAVHHLAHLDVAAAFGANLLLPVVLVVAGWAWLGWVSDRVPRPGRVVPGWLWGALVALSLAFAVARNLPGLDALAP